MKTNKTQRRRECDFDISLELYFLRGLQGQCFGHVPKRLTFWKEMKWKKETCAKVQKQGFAMLQRRMATHWRGWKWICPSRLLSKCNAYMLYQHALKTLEVHIFLTKVLLFYLSFWFMLLRKHRAAVGRKEKSHMADYCQTNKHVQYGCQTASVQTKETEKQPHPPFMLLHASMREYVTGFWPPINSAKETCSIRKCAQGIS